MEIIEVRAGDLEEHLKQLISDTGGNLDFELNRNMLFRIYPDIEEMDQFRLGNYGFTRIHVDTFQDLPNSNILKSIHLDENLIEFLEPGTFRNLPNLEFIDLSSNKMTHIFSGYFPDLPNLKVCVRNN